MDNHKKQELLDTLQRFGIVPVVSLPSVDSALKLSKILVERGLPIAEITFRTTYAADGMAVIKKAFPEMVLLAGTVLTVEHITQAVESGAAAIVSPGFSPRSAAFCENNDIVYIPGVCTPSEIQAAIDAGLDTLKFFPAESSGGAGMLSLFGALYQDVRFMPTGGVQPGNLSSYLDLNNVICCGGTWLCPEHMMVEGRWSEIEARVISVLETMKQRDV